MPSLRYLEHQHHATVDGTDTSLRIDSLGLFARLTDSLLLRIMSQLDAPSLCALQACSRGMYCVAGDDMLWKRLTLIRCKGKFRFSECWKKTCLLRCESQRNEAFPCLRQLLHTSSRLFSGRIGRRRFRCTAPIADFSNVTKQTIPRVPASISPEEFRERFMLPCQPVIITGAAKQWAAMEKWNRKDLLQRFEGRKFKTDEVVNGQKIRMLFENYMEYAGQHEDEDPIYLFDPGFGERAPELLDDFSVPPHFSEDLFRYLGPNKRPLYRWFVIGPERSGSPFHIDPYKTCAWNALLRGRKRWLLTPPRQVPYGVDCDSDEDDPDYDAPEPMKYLTKRYPHTPDDQRPMEGIQEAGDIIFVPTNWWHMVLNLEETIAVTQNYVGSDNFLKVYRYVKKDDPKMKRRWKARLEHKRPDLMSEWRKYKQAHPPRRRSRSTSYSTDSSSTSGYEDSSCDDSE